MLPALALAATAHEPPERPSVVWSSFPSDAALLRDDVAEIAPELRERHGEEEWKAAVLTSELHRHLGPYSILGAKMGIRARERFGVGLDELTVVTRAGDRPPLSCLCDGLQVATGASLGRGSITVDETAAPALETTFRHGGRTLRLSLKSDIAERIAKRLAALREEHGGLNGAYFAAVRESTLDYWRELDRDRIFEEEWLEREPSAPVEAP